MEIGALQRSVNAADLPLDRLVGSSQVSEKDKLAEVSRQFEAMLLRQILTQAQKPLFESDLFGASSTNAIYQDMITEQLADRISEGGSFGFARLLQKELSAQFCKPAGDEVQGTAQEQSLPGPVATKK
jgi:Rod binding domain-containing protein